MHSIEKYTKWLNLAMASVAIPIGIIPNIIFAYFNYIFKGFDSRSLKLPLAGA